MKDAELKIVLAIARQTFGWQRRAISLSVPDFQRLTKLTRPSVITGIKAAMDRGILDREPDGNSFSYWITDPREKSQPVKNFNSPSEISNEDLPVKNFNSLHEESNEEDDVPVKKVNCDEPEAVKNFNQNSQNFLPETVKKVNSQPVKNFNPIEININTNKPERKGETAPPAYMDFGNGRPQQYRAKTYIDGIAARYQRLGMAPKDFTALVDAVLTGMNKMEVAELDTRQGMTEHNSAQECALSLANKGVRTPEAVRNLFDSWYQLDWRGKKGELPTYENLVNHVAALPKLIAARKENATPNGHNSTAYERPATAQFSQREWDEYQDPAAKEIPF